MGTQYLSLLSRRAALPANRTAHTFAAGLAALALVSVGAVVAVFWRKKRGPPKDPALALEESIAAKLQQVLTDVSNLRSIAQWQTQAALQAQADLASSGAQLQQASAQVAQMHNILVSLQTASATLNEKVQSLAQQQQQQ